MHGANRTGRPFTGDHAGILLYRTLYKFGLASAPQSTAADDGLQLLDARITNSVKSCARYIGRRMVKHVWAVTGGVVLYAYGLLGTAAHPIGAILLIGAAVGLAGALAYRNVELSTRFMLWIECASVATTRPTLGYGSEKEPGPIAQLFQQNHTPL